MRRNTALRDKHRDLIRQGHPPCAICGEDIPYDAPHTDPRAYVVDHIIPLAKGGPDALANKQAAHRQPDPATATREPARRRPSSAAPAH